MTVKVSVLGCCVSRDIFNRKFIPNYKDFFNCVSYQHQLSFISLMSDPIPYDDTKLRNNKMTNLTEIQFITEMDKSPLKDLLSVQPDLILIDFYADMLYGADKVNGSYLTGKMNKFSKSNLAKDLTVEDHYLPRKNFDKFFSLWKKKFDEFINFKNEYLPNAKIVINKARASDEFFDTDTQKITKKNLKVNVHVLNSIWERLDNYAINKHHLDYLNYTKKYYMDKNYPFFGGIGIVHMQHNFYLDCFSKLVKVAFDYVSKDLDKNKRIEKCNLLVNSDFEQDFNFWSAKSGDFDLQQENGIKVLHINNENNVDQVKSQMWSSSVQVIDDTEYELSFDLKIKDLSKIDGRQSVFCVRSFKNRKKHKNKDRTESIDFKIKNSTLKGFKLENNEWCKCSFTLKFKGQFVKLAPFLSQNGDVSWKNIVFKRK